MSGIQTASVPAPASPSPLAPTPASLVFTNPVSNGTVVTLVATAEESDPFRLNPVFISLGLPRSAFKTQLGGQPALPPPGTLQDGWRSCRNCQSLVFAADPGAGRCPAGGEHILAGNYALQCGDGGPGLQAGWRRCGKCQSLAFSGNGPGICVAGGGHDTAASPPYALTLGTIPRGQQAGWRWCRKCQGLAMNQGRPGGACPAGGQHDPAGSGAYAVPVQAMARPPRLVRRPQLFLVETYQLSNFRGDLLRDSLVATMQPMLPHQTVTCRVLTRKRTSQEEKASSTVMDAQSTEAGQSFNQQLRQSADSKFETERYDYAMQANFHGKGTMGFGSASARAQVNVAGATNNVRQELANSVDSALDNQVSQANQARKETVRVASSEAKVETTNETEVVVTTANPTDFVKNFGIYQLKQEHISILSLVDAEVMFVNGEPKDTQRMPLFRLDEMLDEVIELPEERTAIRTQIRDCLSAVRDQNDQAQSIIQDDPSRAGGFIVNKKLRSRHELLHADGTVRQVLSAPGVILRATTKQLKKPGATVVAAIQ